MALPEFSMRQLLEAGVHFGHQTHRWNPRMGTYIYGDRMVAKGGRVLFVGTKRQASQPIAEAAERCAQYYMNHRWLGGTLTNWGTVSASINQLKQLEGEFESGEAGYTKREALSRTRKKDKLSLALGGIKEMGGVPDMLFVIDTNKEELAIKEANRLKIPVVAVLDTNCSPDGVDYPIPGNDDASRAIALYCDLIAGAALDGIGMAAGASGIDIGAMAMAMGWSKTSKSLPLRQRQNRKRHPPARRFICDVYALRPLVSGAGLTA